MLDDFFRAGKCVADLDETKIVVNMATRQPKLANVALLNWSSDLMADNMAKLAEIIREVILSRSKITPPAEVFHLLKHMEKRSVSMMLVIRFHPSLVPLFNRLSYYIHMYTFVDGILKGSNLDGYFHLVNNLIFPGDWDARVTENSIQSIFYGKRTYHPKGSVSKYAGEAVPGHGLEEADHDTTSDGGMLFSRADLAKMLYSVFDMMMASMADSLHRQGNLKRMQLDHLFSARAPKPQVQYSSESLCRTPEVDH